MARRFYAEGPFFHAETRSSRRVSAFPASPRDKSLSEKAVALSYRQIRLSNKAFVLKQRAGDTSKPSMAVSPTTERL